MTAIRRDRRYSIVVYEHTPERGPEMRYLMEDVSGVEMSLEQDAGGAITYGSRVSYRRASYNIVARGQKLTKVESGGQAQADAMLSLMAVPATPPPERARRMITLGKKEEPTE